MSTVALQGLRKLELTQQRVARIENFDAIASSTEQVDWIVFSAESSDFFVVNEKIWSFLELIFEISI
jgi:hypothetical protein